MSAVATITVLDPVEKARAVRVAAVAAGDMDLANAVFLLDLANHNVARLLRESAGRQAKTLELSKQIARLQLRAERAERERDAAVEELGRVRLVMTTVADELAETQDQERSASPEYLGTVIEQLRDGRIER